MYSVAVCQLWFTVLMNEWMRQNVRPYCIADSLTNGWQSVHDPAACVILTQCQCVLDRRTDIPTVANTAFCIASYMYAPYSYKPGAKGCNKIFGQLLNFSGGRLQPKRKKCIFFHCWTETEYIHFVQRDKLSEIRFIIGWCESAKQFKMKLYCVM